MVYLKPWTLESQTFATMTVIKSKIIFGCKLSPILEFSLDQKRQALGTTSF